MKKRLAAIAAIAVLGFWACNGGPTAPTTPATPAAAIVSFTISPTQISTGGHTGVVIDWTVTNATDIEFSGMGAWLVREYKDHPDLNVIPPEATITVINNQPAMVYHATVYPTATTSFLLSVGCPACQTVQQSIAVTVY